MAGNQGTIPPNGKIHPGSKLESPIFTRQPGNPIDPDDRQKAVFGFLAAGIHSLVKQLGDLARQIDNRAFVVDEYQVQSSVSTAESVVTVQPIYDFKPEKIESIIVTGPPGNVTLQLGDRFWNLTIPATGIIVIAPVAILLGRNDLRQLTGTAGSYSLELMGIADERYDA
jgi:hypothetical protein